MKESEKAGRSGRRGLAACLRWKEVWSAQKRFQRLTLERSVAPLRTWPGNAGALSKGRTVVKGRSEVRSRAHDLNPQTVRERWPVLLPGNCYSSSSPVPISQERRRSSRGAGRERKRGRKNVSTVGTQSNISMSSRQQLRTSSGPEEETPKD